MSNKEIILKRTIREILLNDDNVSIEEFNELKEEVENEIKEEKENLQHFEGYLTVKKLKEELEKADDNAIVCTERIEDVYFEKHGWKTISIMGNEFEHKFIKSFCANYDKSQKYFYIWNHY